MDILLFRNFSKRNNSTKRPVDSTGEKRSVTLKENTDILNPTFLLSNVDTSVNYIKWNGRYYNVVNVTIDSMGLFNVSCKVDALATWKEDINNTSSYVMYSSSDYSLNIKDERLIPTEEKTIYTEEVPLSELWFSESGCYILTVVSSNANGENGACSVYAMTKELLKNFMTVITAQDFLDQLHNQFTNPLESVVSCHWIPFSYSSMVGSISEIFLAYHGTGVSGLLLSEYVKGNSITAHIPSFTDEHDFTELEPFTTGVLYLPFVGCVPLDLSAYYSSKSINISCKVDIVTGAITYIIGKDVYASHVSTYSGKCSTELPISSSNYDAMSLAGGAIATIGGIVSVISAVATGGSSAVVSGAVGVSAMGVNSAIKSTEVHTQTNGALSSRIGASTGLDIQLNIIRRSFTEEYNNSDRIARIGLPCNKVRKSSGLSGYVQTSGFSLDAPALESERETVNTLLDSGIYLE